MQCSFIWKYKTSYTGRSQNNITNNHNVLKVSTEENVKKDFDPFLWIKFSGIKTATAMRELSFNNSVCENPYKFTYQN